MVCLNNIKVPMEATNRLVLDAFESDILRPEHVERVIWGRGREPAAFGRGSRGASCECRHHVNYRSGEARAVGQVYQVTVQSAGTAATVVAVDLT
jgi:hypothetical protein